MNVTVFGSTGRVGTAAVRRAVEAGHCVRAAVRSLSSQSPFDESVCRVVADVRSPETERDAIADSDAVADHQRAFEVVVTSDLDWSATA